MRTTLGFLQIPYVFQSIDSDKHQLFLDMFLDDIAKYLFNPFIAVLQLSFLDSETLFIMLLY